MPGWIPHQFHSGLVDGFKGEQCPTDTFDQALMHGTTSRGKRHSNAYLPLPRGDVVNQTKVNDV
jgi:hypothetical protein